MLTTRRKNYVVIMAMVILLSIVMVFGFCNFNVVSAEEVTETNIVSDIDSYAIDWGEITKDNLQVGVKGTFYDGDRVYAEYYMTVCIRRIDSDNYKIETMIKINPKDWKTDKYRIDRIAYNFIGKNVELTNREIKVSDGNKLIKKMTKTGFEAVNFSFSGNQANNYPIIEEEFDLKKTGSELSDLTMHFTAIEVRGMVFAKNTKINGSIAKVNVRPSPYMGANPPSYYYNPTYIKNAAYTTQFGRVPEDWQIYVIK